MSESEPASSVLGRLLAQFHVSALLGLEYVVEVKIRDNEEVFKCLLCGTDSDLNGIVRHLLSAGHRLAFLRRHFPVAGRKFSAARVPERGWAVASYESLDTVAARIEARCGRGEVTAVRGLLGWERDQDTIRRRIEEGHHARYSHQHNDIIWAIVNERINVDVIMNIIAGKRQTSTSRCFQIHFTLSE